MQDQIEGAKWQAERMYSNEELLDVIEEYLNAGSKKQRKLAAEHAKSVYLKYKGVEYKNKNE